MGQGLVFGVLPSQGSRWDLGPGQVVNGTWGWRRWLVQGISVQALKNGSESA